MITLLDETGRLDEADTEFLTATVTAWLQEQELPAAVPGIPLVTLVLLDDTGIRELNLRDRGLDEATDVLSYPVHEPDDEGFPSVPFLGDVFISLDTAEGQAAAAGHSLLTEILVLAAHGVTHLLGYDHRTEEEWQVFRTAQSGILQARPQP